MKFVQQVCPMTQHPVMAKAAHYFGLTIKHVPVGPDYKADVKKMEQVGSIGSSQWSCSISASTLIESDC